MLRILRATLTLHYTVEIFSGGQEAGHYLEGQTDKALLQHIFNIIVRKPQYSHILSTLKQPNNSITSSQQEQTGKYGWLQGIFLLPVKPPEKKLPKLVPKNGLSPVTMCTAGLSLSCKPPVQQKPEACRQLKHS